MEKRIKEGTSRVPPCSADVSAEVEHNETNEKKVRKYFEKEASPSSVVVNAEKVKASILKASLDHKLTINSKMFALISDHQYHLGVHDVSKQQPEVLSLDLLKKEKSKAAKKLSEQMVPPGDNTFCDYRGIWPQGNNKDSILLHLMKEYSHRMTLNIAYLVMPFLLQTYAEYRREVKIVVEEYAKAFEEDWPDIVMVKEKSKRHRRFSHPPSEIVIKESRKAIKLLMSHFELDQ